MARFINEELSDKNLTIEEKINDIKDMLPEENIELSSEDIKNIKLLMIENDIKNKEDLINFLYENLKNENINDMNKVTQQDGQDAIHKVNWSQLAAIGKLGLYAVSFFTGGIQAVDNMNNYQPQTAYVQESSSVFSGLEDIEKNDIVIKTENGKISVKSGITGDEYVIGENAIVMPQGILSNEEVEEQGKESLQVGNIFEIEGQEANENSGNSGIDETNEILTEVEQVDEQEFQEASLGEKIRTFISGGIKTVTEKLEEDYYVEMTKGDVTPKDDEEDDENGEDDLSNEFEVLVDSVEEDEEDGELLLFENNICDSGFDNDSFTDDNSEIDDVVDHIDDIASDPVDVSSDQIISDGSGDSLED